MPFPFDIHIAFLKYSFEQFSEDFLEIPSSLLALKKASAGARLILIWRHERLSSSSLLVPCERVLQTFVLTWQYLGHGLVGEEWIGGLLEEFAMGLCTCSRYRTCSCCGTPLHSFILATIEIEDGDGLLASFFDHTDRSRSI